MSNQKVNLRLLVLEMLMSATEGDAPTYSNIVARDTLNKHNDLSRQEKSFVKRLFEGTLERIIELDFVIDSYSKIKTAKMKPIIRGIMRLSVYQILYMDAVPDAAACSEAVKLAQKKGFGTLKGFVNGVLRNIARNKENLEYPSLSVKYSMPEWIVSLWQEQMGDEKTLAVLDGLIAEHPVTIRFRDLSAREDVQNALSENGGSMAAHPYLDYAYKISRTDDIARLPHYGEGAFVVQDASSMLAVEALFSKNFLTELRAADKRVRIADVCAAPGGKTMLAADILKRAGVDFKIEASDISENKVRLMKENFKRCGFDKESVSASARDALSYNAALDETADIVIADVPCSGLGVIGKKRDIKYKMSAEKIEDIIALQRGILKNAAARIKQGGRLLFCTCTINRRENEDNFEWLVKELKLTPVPFEICGGTADKGYFQLLPGINDTDGFFISVFCK